MATIKINIEKREEITRDFEIPSFYKENEYSYYALISSEIGLTVYILDNYVSVMKNRIEYVANRVHKDNASAITEAEFMGQFERGINEFKQFVKPITYEQAV